MVTLGTAGLIAAYVLLALLLLSVNLYSNWSWPVKAGCVALVSLFYLVTYFSLPPLMGWPTDDRLPERFNLLAVQIKEPDKRSGAEGEIYIWVTDVAVGENRNEPRAYRLPFTTDLHEKVATASQKLSKRRPQLGEVTERGSRSPVKPTDWFQGGQESANIRFYDLPPPLFPDK